MLRFGCWLAFSLPLAVFSVQRKEVNTLLDDIIKHITPDRAFEAHYAELIAVVHKILPYFSDYSALFAMVSCLLCTFAGSVLL